MTDRCSTMKQGYATVQQMHDCNLSHTGQSLWLILLLALVLLFVGVMIVLAASRGTR